MLAPLLTTNNEPSQQWYSFKAMVNGLHVQTGIISAKDGEWHYLSNDDTDVRLHLGFAPDLSGSTLSCRQYKRICVA